VARKAMTPNSLYVLIKLAALKFSTQILSKREIEMSKIYWCCRSQLSAIAKINIGGFSSNKLQPLLKNRVNFFGKRINFSGQLGKLK